MAHLLTLNREDKAPDEIRADTGRFLLDGIWGGLEETWKVPGLTN